MSQSKAPKVQHKYIQDSPDDSEDEDEAVVVKTLHFKSENVKALKRYIQDEADEDEDEAVVVKTLHFKSENVKALKRYIQDEADEVDEEESVNKPATALIGGVEMIEEDVKECVLCVHKKPKQM
jgi:hypothetical protein